MFLVFRSAGQISTLELGVHQVLTSQSSMELEKDSTMDVGGLHENDESSHWMSQL